MKPKQLTIKEAFQPQLDLGKDKLFFFCIVNNKEVGKITMEVLNITVSELDNLNETFKILPTVVEDFHKPYPRLSRKQIKETA